MIHHKLLSAGIACMTVLAATFASSIWAPVWAQSAAQADTQAMPPLNIRVVSIETVRAKSTAFIAARDKITAYVTTSSQAIQKEDADLREASAELNRKRTLLSPEVFADERKKFEQRVADFQRKSQEHQKAINKLQLDVIGKIDEKIIEIISQYAEANNVTLILPVQSVLLRADALVMDGYILDRLNKELPSVAVSLPAK